MTLMAGRDRMAMQMVLFLGMVLVAAAVVIDRFRVGRRFQAVVAAGRRPNAVR